MVGGQILLLSKARHVIFSCLHQKLAQLGVTHTFSKESPTEANIQLMAL